MAAANMGQPCPADPIWYREYWILTVRCRAEGCSQHATKPVWEWAALHGVDSRIRLGRLIERMRCIRCGRKNSAAEVTRSSG
jgi:hypothetical protein